MIEQAEDYIRKSGVHYTQWKCLCDCGNIINVLSYPLKSGHTKSCGCLKSKSSAKFNKITKHKTNRYDLKNEYGIGYTNNTNEEFLFDLEDYDRIKNICWYSHSMNGGKFKRLCGRDTETGKYVSMHEYLGFKYYDHIDRNEFNNQKSNLRECSQKENARNRTIHKNNTSGVIGVHYHKRDEKWVAEITVNGKKIWLGYFDEKIEAIRSRLIAEKKYFGEFAPQKELYDKYICQLL